jgi:hypothetical protein
MMGGKSKLFDPEKLEPLYRESRGFTTGAKLSVQVIQKQLTLLNDPSNQEELSQAQQEELKSTVIRLGEKFSAFKQSLEQTTSYVDSQLAGTVQTSYDRSTGTSVREKRIADIRLKK